MARIRLALIGFGRAGQMHYTNINENRRVQLVYIFDIAEALGSITSRLETDGNDARAININELESTLNKASVDCVYITSPTKFHAQHAMAAMKAELPVFVEKPVASSAERAIDMYRMSRDVGVPLYCSFQRRLDPCISQLVRQIHSRALGKLHVLKTTSRDHPPVPCNDYIRLSGGYCNDSAIHDVDLVCYIAQEFPISVYVVGHGHQPGYEEIGDVDTLCIVFKFASGLISIIDMSRSALYGYDIRIEAHTEQGMLQITPRPASDLVTHNSTGSHHCRIPLDFQSRFKDAFKNSLEHFLDVVDGKAVPLTEPLQVVNTARLISACEESLKQGKQVEFHALTSL